jgi:hypothetical protein
MRWWTLIAIAAACDPGKDSSRASDPAPAAVAHDAAADAAASDAPARRAGSVDLGPIGRGTRYSSVRSLLLAGDHVYYSTVDDTTLAVTFRRVPRGGGETETVATGVSIDANHSDRNLAVIGDRLFIIGMANASKSAQASHAPLLEVVDGKAHELARGPTATIVSSGLVAHDGKLYWIAAGTTGDGPTMETTLRGSTRIVARCPKPAIDDCPDLLDGLPPIIADDDRLVQLAPQKAELAARCPCGAEPIRIVGDYVLCHSFDDRPDAPCRPEPELVKLDGSEHVKVKDLGLDAVLAGGHYYHTGNGALLRRAAVTGADEVFAAHASQFTADDRGVVWIDGDHLWAAPH